MFHFRFIYPLQQIQQFFGGGDGDGDGGGDGGGGGAMEGLGAFLFEVQTGF